MGRGTRWKGTAGDHNGPPSRSPPPSPLRTDEHISKNPTHERLCWRMQAILEWYNARKKSSKRVQVRKRDMSMYAREVGTIPEETVGVAHAGCPKGTLALRRR